MKFLFLLFTFASLFNNVQGFTSGGYGKHLLPQKVNARPSTSHNCVVMSLRSNGFGAIKSSSKSVVRNFFMGSKRKSGNGIGNNNNGGNKNPPKGPLFFSSMPDDSERKNSVKAAWMAYNGALEKQPILTKALTSLVGFALGDFLAQKFIDKKDKIDWKRFGRMASFGLLFHGPTGHFFYGFLDSKIPGTAALTVATKVFIDQIIWNPIFGCMFFGYMGAAEGLGPSAIKTRIEKNLFDSVKGSWTVWPIAHAINFRFIPTSQRLLYINSIQIGYNMFLSVLGQRANSKDAIVEVPTKGKKSKK